MAEQFYTILTSIGKAKIANASALGNKVDFKYFALGDGNGTYYNPTESQERLVNEVWRGQIGRITVDEKNPNWIVIETIIPADQGGFMIREAGIIDEKDNLLAVGKYPETYKPAVENGSAKDLYIRMILEVVNTSVVNLKVDPSIILATKKDIEVLEQKMNDIPVTEVIDNLTTDDGTIALSARQGKVLQDNKVDNNRLWKEFTGDLNNLHAPGFYYSTVSVANEPVSNSGLFIEVISHAGSANKLQRVTTRTSNVAYQRTYVRQRVNADWTEWTMIAKSSDLDTKMNKSGDTATGILKAHSNTSYTVAQVRNIILSANDANVSSMKDGEIWIKYK